MERQSRRRLKDLQVEVDQLREDLDDDQAMADGTYATTAQQDAAQLAADAQRVAAQRHAARKTAREKRIAARAA